MASIYSQKGLGLLPVVKWLPYELLFSNNTRVTNNSHVVTYRSLSTVCFAYVKKVGQKDSSQKLSYISNKVVIGSSHTLAGYNDGKPYSKTTDKTNSIYSDKYADVDKEIKSYVNSSNTVFSFVQYYTFYNYDKSAKITEYVLNPSYPSQIQ